MDKKGKGNERPVKRAKIETKLNIRDVVTPLYKEGYDTQLGKKHRIICKNVERIRKSFFNAKKMNVKFLTWIPKDKKDICPVLGILKSPKLKYYRNKESFTIGLNSNDEITIGYQCGKYGKNDFSIETHNDFYQTNKIIHEISIIMTKFIKQQSMKHQYKIYDKSDHKGIWRKFEVRISDQSKQYIIVLILQSNSMTIDQVNALKNDYLKFSMTELKVIEDKYGYILNGVSMLQHNGLNDTPDDTCQMDTLFGDDYIYEYICKLKFRVSSQAFFQVNTISAQNLYNTAANWIKNIENDNIILFDICCGTGTIGMCFSKILKNKVKRIIGIDLNKNAINDAITNAKLNNLNNCEYYAGKAEDIINIHLNKIMDNEYCVAILDPNRPGLHVDVLRHLRNCNRIKKIVYISCNSKSCAHDVIKLCSTPSKKNSGIPFKPIKAIAVDLFPHTEHIEMIILLERLKDNEMDWDKLGNQARQSFDKIQRNLIIEQQNMLKLEALQQNLNENMNENVNDPIKLDDTKL